MLLLIAILCSHWSPIKGSDITTAPSRVATESEYTHRTLLQLTHPTESTNEDLYPTSPIHPDNETGQSDQSNKCTGSHCDCVFPCSSCTRTRNGESPQCIQCYIGFVLHPNGSCLEHGTDIKTVHSAEDNVASLQRSIVLLIATWCSVGFVLTIFCCFCKLFLAGVLADETVSMLRSVTDRETSQNSIKPVKDLREVIVQNPGGDVILGRIASSDVNQNSDKFSLFQI